MNKYITHKIMYITAPIFFLAMVIFNLRTAMTFGAEIGAHSILDLIKIYLDKVMVEHSYPGYYVRVKECVNMGVLNLCGFVISLAISFFHKHEKN